MSTQNRLQASRALKGLPLRTSVPSFSSRHAHCSRQCGLGGWTHLGAGVGVWGCGGKRSPLARRVRPGDPVVHWMRMGEAAAMGFWRWRWVWRERFTAAFELESGQWAPTGRALGLQDRACCPSPGTPVHPPAGPEGLEGPGGAHRSPEEKAALHFSLSPLPELYKHISLSHLVI